MTKTLTELFHSGELAAQQRFDGEARWQDDSLELLNSRYKDQLDANMAAFIARQTFFFIATASSAGDCDCSFRGSEADASGTVPPAALVVDATHLVFPDYTGNHLYNSLGNILTNPKIGLLFIEFQTATRMRVNGGVSLIEEADRYAHLWPQALRYLEVSVTQAYWNCPKRIKASFMAGLRP